MAKYYALYKGDDLLMLGTANEIMKEYGVSRKTFQFWAAPANVKRDKGNRLVVVKIDDDEGENDDHDKG